MLQLIYTVVKDLNISGVAFKNLFHKSRFLRNSLGYETSGNHIRLTSKELKEVGLHGLLTLNSPKLSRPGSWKEPHLLKLIPERKKLRVKVADMEQKS